MKDWALNTKQKAAGLSPNLGGWTAVLVVISNDYGFRPLMQRARECGWGVVVVCSNTTKFDDVVHARLPWQDV